MRIPKTSGSVLLCGATGMLAKRTTAAARTSRFKDLRFETGIVTDDPTLLMDLQLAAHIPNGGAKKSLLPDLYIDANQQRISELNKIARNCTTFHHISKLDLSNFDLILDMASAGGYPSRRDLYYDFSGPILIQDGEAPEGNLIAPPLCTKRKSPTNLYRLGDCVLTGLAPILAALSEVLKDFRVSLLTQYTGKVSGWPVDRKRNSHYLRDDLRQRRETELNRLVGTAFDVWVIGFSQMYGLSHYMADVEVTLCAPLSGIALRNHLSNSPRIKVFQDLTSTEQVSNLAERIHLTGHNPSPVIIVGSELSSRAKRSVLHFGVFIDYKTIAVAANLDVARITLFEMDPRDAMIQTDYTLRYSDRSKL